MISVDTAAAHLAGAMGIPLWVLLPFNADWRWPPFSRSSPWYPSARLFRQTCCGDWKNVIDNVAVALADVEFGSKKPIKF
jgi:ADP-heptose:LPS heptosyltransferase